MFISSTLIVLLLRISYSVIRSISLVSVKKFHELWYQISYKQQKYSWPCCFWNDPTFQVLPDWKFAMFSKKSINYLIDTEILKGNMCNDPQALHTDLWNCSTFLLSKVLFTPIPDSMLPNFGKFLKSIWQLILNNIWILWCSKMFPRGWGQINSRGC